MTIPQLPYRGRKEIVKKKQTVRDIMREVLDAHHVFARDYDQLADVFIGDSVRTSAKKLFNFCKQNIKYRMESDRLQTTRSPGGILYLRHGDCKHYAGFIAGVLDAIRRRTGKNFPLAYRFANYDIFETEPAHVFVVVGTGDKELWIDPVLQEFDTRNPQPINYTDKKLPMALVRISGAPNRKIGLNLASIFTPVADSLTSPAPAPTGTGGQFANAYDAAASQLGKTADLAVSTIPFYSLAKGLIENFFGKGGISDWLTPSGILNEIKYAIVGRQYRGDQYWLGEKFRYYVLGEDIHTRDADVVGDATVQTAITVFSTGFGVPIESYEDILNLQKGADAYIARYTRWGARPETISRPAVERAVRLRRSFFPEQLEGNYRKPGGPPQKWDMNKFNDIPLVAPIPDFNRPTPEMWLHTYTGPIPGGEVRDGIVVTGRLGGETAQAPVATGARGGIPTWVWLAGGAAVLYFLIRRK